MKYDNRKHKRLALQFKVEICHPEHGKRYFVSSNLSDGGLFILTSEFFPVQIGEVVTVQLANQIGDVDEEPPITTMKVVHINPRGVGLEFIEP